MKNLVATLWILLLLTSPMAAEVKIWPVPEGEPLSSFWDVEINGQNIGVLTARTADPPFEKYHYGGEYAFLSVDTDEPIVLKIREKTDRSTDNLTIRPLSLGLVAEKKNDGSFDITIANPCRFSVELNGREHPLLIFVNPLEKNVPQAGENVIVYGPGIHEPEDGRISLVDNQTLYLAPGAIVHCGIQVKGKNIRICGRGIIDSSRWEWRHGPTDHVISIRDSKNVSLEGVIIRGPSHWTVVPVHSEDISIQNIKICGGRVQNDDGINPCNSQRVQISDCFIRTDDDCIAIKGLDNNWGNCEDITVENSVFWCDRARIVLMGHESRAPFMRRITFRNCDIIHSQSRNFLLEPGENMRLENILLENLRFETGLENALNSEAMVDAKTLRFDIDTPAKENWLFVGRPVVNRYMQTQVPGFIRDCTIRNISVTGPVSYAGILFSGADDEHTTDGLFIENIILFNEKMPTDSPRLHFGDHLNNVEVR
ncbi:MAG: glycosyl hydrolase family 28 protein [Planctomycetia bacterium]|nr:glycosyl hydrolase family 28 protein [Planctomycetia bacterium]